MVVKAKILGECTTVAKSTDNEKLWDIVPFDYLHSDKKNAGGIVICNYSDKTGLLISCPNCGVISMTGKHKITYIDGIVNVKPSLVMQCCKWHGHLTDNEFRK